MRLRIGIDLMGGDNPPELLFEAILKASTLLFSDQFLVVIATKETIDQLTPLLDSSKSAVQKHIHFHPCEDVILMTDNPLVAIRRKKKSSLVIGMQLLKKKNIDAFISCGNTGALIASAAMMLPLLPGISHPALLATLPTAQGPLAVLDVGGNLLNKAQHLVRLAFLGAQHQRSVHGIKTPRVGLLNVGAESKKGNTEVRQAYEILANYQPENKDTAEFVFSGNVEGRDLFKGHVDVLVTDGFTGNILLKTAEGVASFIFDSLEDQAQNGTSPTFEKSFKELKQQFNYVEYPGAVVCGVEGVVIKVHGNAGADTLYKSILSVISCFKTS